jgi:hypothetical protein
MLLYIRNKNNTNDFEDNFLGIFIPGKSGTEEGVFACDLNDLNGIMRYNESASDNLHQILSTGVSGSLTYGVDLYVSPDGTPGEDKVDVGAAGSTPAAKALLAYSELRELMARKVQYDGAASNYLSEDRNVQDAIDKLDQRLYNLTTLHEKLNFRNHVKAITADNQFNVSGPLPVTSVTFPLSDDMDPYNVDASTFVNGTYILYKGATPTDDKIFKVESGEFILQTGDYAINKGYTYIVKHDLLEEWEYRENQAMYSWDENQGLFKLADIDWNEPLPGGMKSYNTISEFLADKAEPRTEFTEHELVFIVDAKRFVMVLTHETLGVTHNVDWAYIGSSGYELSGTLRVDTEDTKVLDNKNLIIPNNSPAPKLQSIKYDPTTGLNFVYNGTEWLSVLRKDITFASNHADGQYLNLGTMRSGLSGWLANRNLKIKSISAKIGSGNQTKEIEIRVNGTTVSIHTPTASGVIIVNNLDLMVYEGEFIQVFASSDGLTSAAALNVSVSLEVSYVI